MMEVLGLDVPLWTVLTLCVCITLYIYGTWTFDTFRKLGIPYRTPRIPCLGNLPVMLSQPVTDHGMQHKVLFPGKISGSFVGRMPMLEVGDADFWYQISTKQFAKFRNRRNMLPGERFNSSLFFIDDDHWKHVRSALTPTFSTSKLKLMYDSITHCADRLVLHLKGTDSSPINIGRYTSGYTAEVIAITAFGLDIDAQSSTDHPFVSHAGTMVGIPRTKGIWSTLKLILNGLTLLVFPISVKRFLNYVFGLTFLDNESCDYFEALISNVLDEVKGEDVSKKNKNFIMMVSDKLVDLDQVDRSTIHEYGDDCRDGKRIWTTAGLTKEDVYSNAVIFIAAGYDTAAAALQFFLYMMALHPDIQDKVYESILEVCTDGNINYEQLQQLHYLEFCIKETLRMLPPVGRVERVCGEDTVVNEVFIPKGMTVSGLIYAIHHDCDYWTKPHIFNPDRFSPECLTDIQQKAFLPFGGGSRMCIASRLAMIELKVGLVKVLTQFTFEKTAKTPQLSELEFLTGTIFLQTKYPIQLCALPRR